MKKVHIFFDGNKWRVTNVGNALDNWPNTARAFSYVQWLNECRAMQYFTKG